MSMSQGNKQKIRASDACAGACFPSNGCKKPGRFSLIRNALMRNSKERNRKGQASLIDILVLGMFISLTLILSNYIGEEQVKTEIVREEAIYIQSALQSALNYKSDSYGEYQNTADFRVREAMDIVFCNETTSNYQKLYKGVNETIKDYLNKSIKTGYNYIFFASTDEKQLYVYNSQSTVCIDYVPVATLDMELSCGKNWLNDQLPILGMWPSWKNVPENC